MEDVDREAEAARADEAAREAEQARVEAARAARLAKHDVLRRADTCSCCTPTHLAGNART